MLANSTGRVDPDNVVNSSLLAMSRPGRLQSLLRSHDWKLPEHHCQLEHLHVVRLRSGSRSPFCRLGQQAALLQSLVDLIWTPSFFFCRPQQLQHLPVQHCEPLLRVPAFITRVCSPSCKPCCVAFCPAPEAWSAAGSHVPPLCQHSCHVVFTAPMHCLKPVQYL